MQLMPKEVSHLSTYYITSILFTLNLFVTMLKMILLFYVVSLKIITDNCL